MTAPSTPWNLKGVSTRAREAAKHAASRDGIPIGAWLAAAIRRTAAAERAAEAVRSAATPRQSAIERMVALSGAGPEIMATAPAPPPPPGTVQPPANQAPQPGISLDELNGRIAIVDQRVETRFAQLSETVERILHRIESIEDQRDGNKGAPPRQLLS